MEQATLLRCVMGTLWFLMAVLASQRFRIADGSNRARLPAALLCVSFSAAAFSQVAWGLGMPPAAEHQCVAFTSVLSDGTLLMALAHMRLGTWAAAAVGAVWLAGGTASVLSGHPIVAASVLGAATATACCVYTVVVSRIHEYPGWARCLNMLGPAAALVYEVWRANKPDAAPPILGVLTLAGSGLAICVTSGTELYRDMPLAAVATRNEGRVALLVRAQRLIRADTARTVRQSAEDHQRRYKQALRVAQREERSGGVTSSTRAKLARHHRDELLTILSTALAYLWERLTDRRN